ncbi:MAG: T9SS type A sorting domain-containing protein [Bacteroidota bacterium]
MKFYFTSLLFLLFAINVNAQIVISQYVETSSGSTPKGIEIWNTSASDIDLSVTPITIFKGTNGNPPSLDHTVDSGILKAGNVIVVGTSDMALNNLDAPCLDALYSLKAFTFNGDDALELYLDGVLQDVFGDPGNDPGSAWTGSGVSTANSNIQLMSGITTGDLDGWTDPSERFETVGAGTTLTGFGQPTDGCPMTSETILNFETIASSIDEDGMTIDVCVTIVNPSDTDPTTVDLELDGASTATNGDDFEDGAMLPISFPFTLTFPANSSTNECLTITITDDMDVEPIESIILNLTNPTGGSSAELGSSITHEVSILDNDTNIPTTDEIRINEVDCNTPSTDVAEFIELFGLPNYNMDGLVLVLYNGSGDESYDAIDLTGFSLDNNGYFIIGGGASAPGNPEISLGNNFIQNGADAVALYVGTSADFPNGTAVTSINLIDALVYDTNDPDDSGLLDGLNQTEQIDENSNNNTDFQSIQRGSWFVSNPTPRSMNVLPVKLTFFGVDRQSDGNYLKWTTETEVNNDYFEILRSKNGVDFETIGRVVGNGTSNRAIDYAFVDEKPTAGLNYYRLKQVDYDGAFEFTYIVKVENKLDRVKIYPTKINTTINVEIEDTESATLTVMNNMGQVFKTSSLTSTLNTIDISELPSGIYYARVESETQLSVERIIKY